MGLGNSSVNFLYAAKSIGVDFGNTLMIGRQGFWPSIAVLDKLFSLSNYDRDVKAFLDESEYSEAFFSFLGANKVQSLDFSPYEGAEIIHDMNLPIPTHLKNKFSVVHDGGSLEHIFNIPQALKNCMEMVKVGGHFTQVTVANNLMGHGFWQISPELNFRALSAANGFQIETLLLHENVPRGGWFDVTDPDALRSRVKLCNSVPTYIMTIAKKVKEVEIFSTVPLQSDYVTVWHSSPEEKFTSENSSLTATPRKNGSTFNWKQLVPVPVRRAIKFPFRWRSGAGFDQPCYRRVSEARLLDGSFKRANKN